MQSEIIIVFVLIDSDYISLLSKIPGVVFFPIETLIVTARNDLWAYTTNYKVMDKAVSGKQRRSGNFTETLNLKLVQNNDEL